MLFNLLLFLLAAKEVNNITPCFFHHVNHRVQKKGGGKILNKN